MLVVDDHGAIREALRIMLETHGLTVVGEAADGAAAVRNAAALQPDVVLMDLRMPGVDGVTATRDIVERGLGDVLVLTSFDEDELVFGAIAAGAAGFLLKTADASTLIDAVHRVAAGEGVLDPRVTRRALAALAGLAGRAGRDGGAPLRSEALDDPVEAPVSLLTDRERDVLAGIAQGWSNAELAERLGIALPTAKTHVSNVLAKLGARSRTHAVAIARELDPGE